MIEFKDGDKVIWDSLSGYEVATFVGEGVMYDSYKVIMMSGCCNQEEISLPKSNIIPFTPENLREMVKKYEYIRSYK